MPENIVLSAPDEQVALAEIAQPLYHRKQFAVTAAQNVTFFSEKASGSTKLDTNLDVGGQLSNKHSFDIWGLSFALAFGTPYADVIKFYNSAYFIFHLSGRVIVEGPMIIMPSTVGLRGFATTTAVESYSNGEAHPMAYLPCNVGKSPVQIGSQQSFYLEVVTAAAAVFSATFYAWAFLHGIWRKDR
jgi:hypothetical protein